MNKDVRYKVIHITRSKNNKTPTVKITTTKISWFYRWKQHINITNEITKYGGFQSSPNNKTTVSKIQNMAPYLENEQQS